MKTKDLKVIPLRPEDFEAMEKRILEAFKRLLYAPILKELKIPANKIENARKTLADALAAGRITHRKGVFRGPFNSSITIEIKELGGVWDNKEKVFKVPLKKLPVTIRAAIATGEARFQEKLAAIDKKIAAIIPAEIAGSIKLTDIFDSSLWRIDRDVASTLKGISVPPQLTPERAKKIAEEWRDNMDLWITDFTELEIGKLRKAVQRSAFAGNRYESLVGSIQKSYGVTENKARFLARQETSLLMTKFKESRYTDSGVNEYRWRCVAGSKLHPVRPAHKKLDGSLQRWDSPPITSEQGKPVRRNNPGQDFNCRCMAVPVVKFRE